MRRLLLLIALLAALAVAPRVAADPPLHGLGAVVSGTASVAPARLLDTSAPLPAAVDLSADAPPPGDQGSVNSCVSWATGYTLLGWYAHHYNLLGAPYAPMFVYSQVANGQNVGTSFEGNLAIEQAQGIDTQADYTQGDDDYTDPPTPAEVANALSYRITGWQQLLGSGATNQQVLESALAAGTPVGIGLAVYTNFYNAGPDSAVIGPPGPADTYVGSHAVAVLGYSDQGIRIENQWGAGWGDGGYATLTWGFVNTQLWGAYAITGFAAPSAIPPPATATATAVPPATPTATATATAPPPATPTSAPFVSATATEAPVATLTPAPSSTSTAMPSLTATPAPSPTGTDTATATVTTEPDVSPSPSSTGTATPLPAPSATATMLAPPVASATPSPTATPSLTPMATPRPLRHPLLTLLFWRWVWLQGIAHFVGVRVAVQ